MRAAILQSCTGIDPEVSAIILTSAIDKASADGADMLFTPEMSGVLDRNRSRSAAVIATEGEDRVLAAVREAAAKAGLWVHLGSLALRSGKGGDERLVNRGFVIDGSGEIRARYDKIHLFDIDLPSGESWRESAAYAPGESAVVVDTPWGKLGLSICYDLRFPDLYQALSNAGATMLAIPAAFTVPTGEAHWHVLQRARAIESSCWVIAAAQSGQHEDGRATYGHSLVIDPWGEVVLDMGAATGVGYAEIEESRTTEIRARIPVITHRQRIGAAEITA
ncbi:MAG: carbon-nitrogen hydrolase family protein [Sphingomonadaceae bacterium]